MDFPGEGDQGGEFVALALDVFIDSQLPADSFQAAGDDEHGFGFATDQRRDIFAEVLDDDLDLLNDIIGMQADPAHDVLQGLRLPKGLLSSPDPHRIRRVTVIHRQAAWLLCLPEPVPAFPETPLPRPADRLPRRTEVHRIPVSRLGTIGCKMPSCPALQQAANIAGAAGPLGMLPVGRLPILTRPSHLARDSRKTDLNGGVSDSASIEHFRNRL